MFADTFCGRIARAVAVDGPVLAAGVAAIAVIFSAQGGEAASRDGHRGHYGPGHWYPTECCSRMDCRPVPDDTVRMTAAGWLVTDTEEVIPFGHRKERRSQDGQFHRCSLAFRPNARADTADRTICLFVPGQMM